MIGGLFNGPARMDAAALAAAPDVDVLGEVAVGDKRAMQILYRRHQPALLAFLRTRGAAPGEAEDVLHDTMLEVWRAAARYRGQSTVRTWVYTIARNKLIDRHRRSDRLTFVDEMPEAAAPDPDPEAVAISASDARRVRRCLDTLKAAHRAVIRMAFFDDLTYPEIAEVEGIPTGTVKTRIHHAKQLLLRCLGHR